MDLWVDQQRPWICLSESRGSSREQSEDWRNSPKKAGWDSWSFSEKWDLTASFQYIKWHRIKLVRGFICCLRVIELERIHIWKLKRFWLRLGIRNKLFPESVVRHWNRFPREAVNVQLLAMFKARLYGDLGSLIYEKWQLQMAGIWTCWSLWFFPLSTTFTFTKTFL